MVSWQLSDLPKLVSTLITGANIDELRRGSPCQTAHVLFMCLRYADHCHDEKQTKQLLESVASSIQQLTQVHTNTHVHTRKEHINYVLSLLSLSLSLSLSLKYSALP